MVATRQSLAIPPATSRVPGHAVLVGVDSAPASRAAVEWAAAEAVVRRAPLHIVHSWTWPHLAPWLTSADRTMREQLMVGGEKLISEYRLAARHVGVNKVSGEVREGAADEVLNALSEQADLLVVGSHHLGPIARTVLGSTGRAVAAESRCPTIVVTGRAGGPHRASKLVVGVSAAANDEAVLQFAFDYAESHDVPIEVLFCWDTAGLPITQLPIPQTASVWLAESVAGWRSRYLTVPVQASVRAANPVVALVTAAGADGMIVVGRRGHRPVLLGSHIGSVAVGALHHAECAVAVVPN